MSKRYGRNQKRKARELLSQERELRERAEAHAASIEAVTACIRGKWQDILQLIERTVEPSCLIRALASEIKEVVTELPGPAPLVEPLLQEMAWHSVKQAPTYEQMTKIELHPLLVGVSRCEFRRQIIARVHYRGGEAYYLMSEAAIANAPDKWLAERIATDLLHLLRKNGAVDD